MHMWSTNKSVHIIFQIFLFLFFLFYFFFFVDKSCENHFKERNSGNNIRENQEMSALKNKTISEKSLVTRSSGQRVPVRYSLDRPNNIRAEPTGKRTARVKWYWGRSVLKRENTLYNTLHRRLWFFLFCHEIHLSVVEFWDMCTNYVDYYVEINHNLLQQQEILQRYRISFIFTVYATMNHAIFSYRKSVCFVN